MPSESIRFTLQELVHIVYTVPDVEAIVSLVTCLIFWVPARFCMKRGVWLVSFLLSPVLQADVATTVYTELAISCEIVPFLSKELYNHSDFELDPGLNDVYIYIYIYVQYLPNIYIYIYVWFKRISTTSVNLYPHSFVPTVSHPRLAWRKLW